MKTFPKRSYDYFIIRYVVLLIISLLLISCASTGERNKNRHRDMQRVLAAQSYGGSLNSETLNRSNKALLMMSHHASWFTDGVLANDNVKKNKAYLLAQSLVRNLGLKGSSVLNQEKMDPVKHRKYLLDIVDSIDVKESLVKSSSGVISTVGHSIHTVALLSSISVVAAIKEKLNDKNLDPKDLEDVDFIKLIYETSSNVANSTDLWASILGGLSTSVPINYFEINKKFMTSMNISAKPILLGGLSQKEKFKKLFPEVVARMSVTLVAFGGWEAAKVLMGTATSQMNEKDKKFTSSFFNLLIALAKDPSNISDIAEKNKIKGYHEAWRSLKQVISKNIKDPNLRKTLFSNIFRLGIFSSETLGLVGSITIGTILSGGIGGLAGLLVYVLVPEEFKEPLHKFMWDKRRWQIEKKAIGRVYSIKTMSKLNFSKVINSNSVNKRKEKVESIFIKRRKLRETRVDVELESIYHNLIQIKIKQSKIDLAKKGLQKSPEEISDYLEKNSDIKSATTEDIKSYALSIYNEQEDLEEQLKEIVEHLQADIENLVNFYREEVEYLSTEKDFLKSKAFPSSEVLFMGEEGEFLSEIISVQSYENIRAEVFKVIDQELKSVEDTTENYLGVLQLILNNFLDYGDEYIKKSLNKLWSLTTSFRYATFNEHIFLE